MTKLPKFLLSRLALPQSAADPHPDPGALAAFAGQGLSARERADLLEHLARCPECRDVLAVASLSEVQHRQQIVPWKWSWLGAAAAACLLAALFWRPASLEKMNVKIAPPAPPSVTKEEQPKSVAKPRARQTVASRQPPITLRQTVNLPPRTLNLTPLTPPSAVTETASLKIPEAAPDFEEKSAPRRTGIAEQTKTLAFGLRANAAKSMARPMLLRNAEKSQWVLDQTLRKSDDGGRTWTTVHVDDRARLYALSAAGSDIWVGGADGALFHSNDSGRTWKSLVVAAANTRLTATITRIETRAENWIELKTQSGDWLTVDGGLHWQQQ